MALFKIYNNFTSGSSINDQTSYNQGYCYLDSTTMKLWVDTTAAASGRKALNAAKADAANITSTKYGVCYFNDTAGAFKSTAAGTAGQYLKSGGANAAPSWESFSSTTVGLSNVSDNANLNGVSGAKGDLIYWSAANTPARLTAGTNGHVLTLSGGVPTWAAAPASVTVTLNGSTTTTPSFYAPISAGLSSQVLTGGTSGQPAWATANASLVGLSNVSNNAVLNGESGAAGDLIYWSAANTPAHLAISSTAGDVLTVSSQGNLVWTTPSTGAAVYANAVDTGTTATYYLIGQTSIPASSVTYELVTNVQELSSVYFTNHGYLYATRVYNAVWNDYAEYRKTNSLARPGQVVIDQDDGSMIISTSRLQSGAHVVTDTFGSCMGETKQAQTPVAVSGRVLVYPYQNREMYHAGMAVCTAPGGTVDIMSREEIMAYPERIVGIVSEIPDYKIWGTGNVNVDNRIWITVR